MLPMKQLFLVAGHCDVLPISQSCIKFGTTITSTNNSAVAVDSLQAPVSGAQGTEGLLPSPCDRHAPVNITTVSL